MVTLAVAVGDGPVDDLVAAWRTRLDAGDATLVRDGPRAVAWSTRSLWVGSHDDGDLLVVLDGRIHGDGPSGGQAGTLAGRVRSSGPGFARGLSGDFVAVVLERSSRTLMVARDPLGVRPWYQSSRGRHHAGASEVATLVALPWVDGEVDEVTAIEHLAGATASLGRTFHRGITTLRPGTTWIHRDGSARAHRHHLWDLRPDRETTWQEAVERCRHELDEAVRRRMDGPGPATSELSGGLDSSAVVGTIVGLGEVPMVGRLVFDGPHADERPWSDAVIEHWGLEATSSRPWIPEPDEAVALTSELARPLPDPHFLMFADLRRTLLSAGRPEALTGLGGDDAFVTSGMGSVLVSAVQLRQWPVLARTARASVLHPARAWRNLHRPVLHHLARRGRGRPAAWVDADAAARVAPGEDADGRPPRVTGIDAIDERVGNLTEGYDAAILESQAVVADLVGARSTHPFLDPRLIEATYGLDPTWPTRGDHTRALQADAYRDRLPPTVAARRSKADFAEVFWPQVLDPSILGSVARGPLRERGWLDLTGFEDLVARAKGGAANAAIPLARCVSLDRWVRSR